jgi:superfamily II DNA or RNA helicase
MTENQEYLPTFATNRLEKGESVEAEVNRLFRILRDTYKETPEVLIATAYINPAGFNLLADELEKSPRIRLLLGAEPDEHVVQAQAAEEKGVEKVLAQAVSGHEDWLRHERDLTGFTRGAISEAARMVAWLRDADPDGTAKVEVRRFTKGFLHGKAYISSTAGMEGVLAGSSNMTYAGLKLNAELNLGYPAGDPQNGKKVVEWFEEYWAQSVPYDLAGVYEAIWAPHTPWEIFLRMLLELYGAVLEEERPEAGHFALTSFQTDGVARMKRLLESNGGVIVADEVGLGKTFLAGEVMLEATDVKRQRVLIVCPAALKDSMWQPFIQKWGFRLTDVMSYDEVRQRVKPDHDDHTRFMAQVQDYALIVVDEAHNLRNPTAERSKAIDQVILAGKYPKQVMLLTATPVNNSLNDLDTLLRYFIRDDSRFANIDIPSIRKYIKRAQDVDPENLTPDLLFQLMDQVAVRRTRKFIKDNYPNDSIRNNKGELVPIRFPTARVRRVDYELDEKGNALVDAVITALTIDEGEDLYSAYTSAKADPERLMLARYTPSRYLRGAQGVEQIQIQNAGLLRSALLKRLESSAAALHLTLQTLEKSHRSFLAAIDKGFVLEGEALRAFVSSESEDLEVALDQLDDEALQKVKPIELFHIEALVADARSDLELLGRLSNLAQKAVGGTDPKFEALLAELTRMAEEARRPSRSGLSAGDRRKVVIFSTYSDTVLDIHERLRMVLESNPSGALADYVGRVAEPQFGSYASVHRAGKTGGVDQGGRARVIESFAPKTASRLNDNGEPTGKDLFDILITTDVLAEGVNLQQAGQMINYDLPWNPMKIVQRHGRVDRLFSEHEEVHLGLFFPASHLDEMLNLQKTLERKLAQAEAAVGASNVLPGRENATDVVFHDPAKITDEIESILERGGVGSALSGEDFRRRLFRELEGFKSLEEKIKHLPYGAGSGFVNPRAKTNGYVFCVKIGDHPNPWFRYVQADDDWNVVTSDGNPVVVVDQLTSLSAADPGDKNTLRVLSDQAYQGAFDAWQVAQISVHKAWQRLTDPNNLQAEVPAAFDDAAALVKNSGQSLGVEKQTELLSRLRAVPSTSVARQMRRILSSEVSLEQKLKSVVELLDSAGIRPAEEPKSLPPVSQSEVRLVAWMAVSRG